MQSTTRILVSIVWLACWHATVAFNLFNPKDKAASWILQQSTPTAKEILLQEFDDPWAFNRASKRRSQLVADMTKENPILAPGSTASFAPVAAGTWRIVYAPHISTMGSLFQGRFDPVYYIMKPNGQMTSHARYSFPILGSGWLSVSGTYGSQDENKVCRVDFGKAWIKLLNRENVDKEAEPYQSFDAVPSSPWKNLVRSMGKFFFVEAVSVFPVSYLDKDTIVFEFELLGTRICARKVDPVVR